MSLKNCLRSKKAQSSAEYFILFMIVALASVAFFGRINSIFEGYFSSATSRILR